ncbi:MAG TPA: carboxylesterase family protein [Bryobacteraceae bacterium]|nr:carboxylesterase family protein [Bryobacteraceae bacterium]
MLRSLLVLIALPCIAMDTTVKLDSGKISGAESGGVVSFKGIPYVAPPTGDLRWKPPHTIAPWPGTRPAKDFGAACPQLPTLEKRYGIKFDNLSEDCLTLNVWTAANNASEHHPVIFWIHFGGNAAGSGSMVDGSALARQGAVVVSINYRLGPFGFLAHPGLSKESSRNSSGNYGLLDQVAALLWVHRNIEKFGGDPQNVTICGVSAGANDVGGLMTSPLTAGLFHRAIFESGEMFPPSDVRLAAAEQSGLKLYGADITALRLRSAREIMAAGGSFEPIIDGWVIPQSPTQIFASGAQAKVPLIVGTNADEGSVFTKDLALQTTADYRAYLVTNYAGAETLLKLYPAADETQARSAAAHIFTDYMIASARTLARHQAKVNPKTFVYHFTHSTGPLGAFHTSEVPFVFGSDPGSSLAKIMSAAWVKFAATGDPGWPAYTAASEQYMEFGDTIKISSELHKKELDALPPK